MFEKIYKKENELLSKYSTIKIGGNARYIVFPKNITEVKYAISTAKENNLKYFILGNGSNTLFDDDGFDGVVICLKNCTRKRSIFQVPRLIFTLIDNYFFILPHLQN